MPSVFVVSEVGPLEPNIYRAIEHEPPKVSLHDLPEKIMAFVESIWQTYGSQELEALTRLAMQDPAFKEAESVSGLAAIIDLDAMRRHHTPIKNLHRSRKFQTNCLTIFQILFPISSLRRAMRRAMSVRARTAPRRVASLPPSGFPDLRQGISRSCTRRSASFCRGFGAMAAPIPPSPRRAAGISAPLFSLLRLAPHA